MSLHTLATQLQSAGRGDDSVLVHMTPGEVGGLQTLAKAHGGSLTTNPETGLPEAGFLSSILPMVAGFALNAVVPGLGALGSAALVGGGTALATGSLQKGLMAGLGAYGGAGLGAGLSSMGTAAAAPSVGVEAAKQGVMATPVFPTATAPATSGLAATNQAVLNSPMMTGQLGYGGFNAANFMGTPAASTAAATAVPPATAIPSVVQSTPIYGASEAASLAPQTATSKLTAGLQRATSGIDGMKQLYGAMPKYSALAGLGSLAMGMSQQPDLEIQKQKSLIRPYDFAYNPTNVAAEPYTGSAERMHFAPVFTARTPYEAPGPEYMAAGGMTGPVEQMSQANAIGANTGYPMANLNTQKYSYDSAMPVGSNVVGGYDAAVDAYTGEPRFAEGGVSTLGDYSDGGRLLKGPGNGTSDSIPAVIGNKQPARLAEGEFVLPARIVSELGNGSTEAGAKQLYAMMDRIQKARRKTVGKDKVAYDAKARNELPA